MPKRTYHPEATRQAAPPEESIRLPWVLAAHAAESKKASRLRILDLREISSFTDCFVICSGSNMRQIQAISDEVELVLKRHGRRPLGIEGYERAEWVLTDYGEFIVHVFSESAREFYDLERLWRHAKEVEVPAET